MVPILTKRNVIYGSSTMNKEEERNTLLQAAYIIRTFFCHEARELVKKKRRRKGELLSFFLLLFPSSSFSLSFGPWQSFLKKAIVTWRYKTQDVTEKHNKRVRLERKNKNQTKEKRRSVRKSETITTACLMWVFLFSLRLFFLSFFLLLLSSLSSFFCLTVDTKKKDNRFSSCFLP